MYVYQIWLRGAARLGYLRLSVSLDPSPRLSPTHTSRFLSYSFASVVGLVLFATLVGFISDGVTSKMDAIAEGESKVCASGHTLILGWNEVREALDLYSSI